MMRAPLSGTAAPTKVSGSLCLQLLCHLLLVVCAASSSSSSRSSRSREEPFAATRGTSLLSHVFEDDADGLGPANSANEPHALHAAFHDKNTNDDETGIRNLSSSRLWQDQPLRLSFPLEPLFPGETSANHIQSERTRNGHAIYSSISSSHPPERSVRRLRTTQTGTTIVGVTGRDCVVLAADARATAGTLVADKACRKIHTLSPFATYAAGAGTSADIVHLTRLCRYTFQLQYHQQQQPTHNNKNYDSGQDDEDDMSLSRSALAQCRWLQSYLYERSGSCQASLIVGGMMRQKSDSPSSRVSISRPILRTIQPHGNMDAVEYTALGSGGLAAMAVLESAHAQLRRRQQQQIDNEHGSDTRNSTMSSSSLWTQQEAVALAVQAVQAGIDNDLGSGSYVDVCIIPSYGPARLLTQYAPEETLPNLPDTVSSNDSTNQRTMVASTDSRATTIVPQGGVNGFGNFPHIVASRRIGYEANRKAMDAKERWKGILN